VAARRFLRDPLAGAPPAATTADEGAGAAAPGALITKEAEEKGEGQLLGSAEAQVKTATSGMGGWLAARREAARRAKRNQLAEASHRSG